MQNISVTLIQSDIYWENPAANLAMFEEKIWQISGKTDIIVLPEMFTTGFTMNPSPFAEPMNLTTFKWMRQLASQTGAVITGSFIVKVNERFFNRLVWMQPDGEFTFYDKKHLFRLAGETNYYTGGTHKVITSWKGWNFRPLICYDLRFPEWSRNQWENDKAEYDCLLYVASWPRPRHHTWEVLLRARAAENLSYGIGVNRIGTDNNGHDYMGGSAVVDFSGKEIFDCKDAEIIQTIVLDKDALLHFRQKFPFYLDNDYSG
jgi:predicted amidohydrolase